MAKLEIEKHKSTLKRILNYIGSYKWLVVLSLILAAVTVATTLYAWVPAMWILPDCLRSFAKLQS